MAEQTETRRQLSIEVPAEVVARETEAILGKYQKLARIPGFRRGHVPASIIRQRFSEEIKNDVVDALVPRYFRQESEKQGLQPVSQPRVTELEIKQGEPLRFKAEFEVLPTIELADYRSLKVGSADTAVSAEDVQAALERLREQNATFSGVEEDRGLEDGDFAQVTLTGNPIGHQPPATGASAPGEGEETAAARSAAKSSQASAGAAAAPRPVHMDEVLVEVGGKTTVNEFSENLRGAKAGEERSFDVTYPADFSDSRLAGQSFNYHLKVLGLKRKSVPELNDDFAREVSADFKTVADLEARVREGMEAEKAHQAEHQAKEQLMEQLVAQNDFPVPDALVERQVDHRLERGLRALASQGMSTEDMRKMDFPRLRAGQREAAVREVKSSLILERIAEAEGVAVTEEEVTREIDAIARQARQPSDALRARLEKEGGLERLRSRLRHDKTLDMLYRRSRS